MTRDVNRYQLSLLLGFTLLAVAMCVRPPHPDDQILQQTPTVLSIGALALSLRRGLLSSFAFTMAIAFMCLHVVGARWIYSFVPYDDWTSRLFGFEITRVFGFRRNHYDRLVHFSFGLLIAWPARELVARWMRPARGFLSFVTVMLIIAWSALYEFAEWFVALTFAPDWADRYLGQQGDPWDAHHDMGLATLGATLSMIAAALAARTKRI